jgi:hypothetical protein
MNTSGTHLTARAPAPSHQATAPRAPGRAAMILDEVARKARYGEVAFSLGQTAYGIAWALQTGRLPGRQSSAIERTATGRQILGWLLACHAAAPTMGDVPAWLIANI